MRRLVVLLAFLLVGSGCAVINHPTVTATSYVVQGVRFYFSTFVPSEIVVVSTGTGETREKAIDNALLAAVQEALGVLVVSEVMIRDDQVLKNIAILYSDGVVNSYKVGQCKGDSRQSCEITAVVSATRLQKKFSSSGAVAEVDGKDMYGQYITSKNAIFQRKKLAEYYLSNIRKNGLDLKIESIKVLPTTANTVPIEVNYTVKWNPEFKKNAISFFKNLQKETGGKFEYYSYKRKESDYQFMLTHGERGTFIQNDKIYINTFDKSFYDMMNLYVHADIKVWITPFRTCDTYQPQRLSGIFAMSEDESKRKIVVYEYPEVLKNIDKVSLSLGCWK